MKTVLIAGGSGLVGQRLSELLDKKNYQVILLSRRKNLNARFPTYQWNLDEGTIDSEAIEQANYIINLAGAGIADKRWSSKRKKEIIDSRVKSNELIANKIKGSKHLKAFLGAAAIGYYGNRGDQLMKESDVPGKSGFLAESCIAWEKSFEKIKMTTVRTVIIRIGVVLSTKGGALEKMLLPAKFGLGSYFGNGSQYFSWIHIDDICQMFIDGIEKENMNGVFNGVAPNPVTNKEITQSINKVSSRFGVLLPVPEFALRLAMGEMADVVLHSTRVSAEKMLKQGFSFQFPDLEPALNDLLVRKI